MLYALNKADLLETEEINQKIDMLNLTESKKWIAVSAKTGNNVNQLKELIKDKISLDICQGKGRLSTLGKRGWTDVYIAFEIGAGQGGYLRPGAVF